MDAVLRVDDELRLAVRALLRAVRVLVDLGRAKALLRPGVHGEGLGGRHRRQSRLDLGFGRIVVSEIEAPNISANLWHKVDARSGKATSRPTLA